MKVGSYRRTLEREFKGKKVVSLEPLENANGSLPRGTRFTIMRKHAGFELLSDECVMCGIRLRISKVQPSMVSEAYDADQD